MSENVFLEGHKKYEWRIWPGNSLESMYCCRKPLHRTENMISDNHDWSSI